LNIKIPANVLAVDLLNGIEGVHCIRPNVTFYPYPNVSGAMKETGLTDLFVKKSRAKRHPQFVNLHSSFVIPSGDPVSSHP